MGKGDRNTGNTADALKYRSPDIGREEDQLKPDHGRDDSLRNNESVTGEGITTINEIIKQASSVNTTRNLNAGDNGTAMTVFRAVPVLTWPLYFHFPWRWLFPLARRTFPVACIPGNSKREPLRIRPFVF